MTLSLIYKEVTEDGKQYRDQSHEPRHLGRKMEANARRA